MSVHEALRQEHGRSMKMFSVLQKLLEGQEPEAGALEERLRRLVHMLKRYVEDCHHCKEEEAVFPELLRLEARDTDGLIEELVGEHRRAKGLLGQLQDALHGARPDLGKEAMSASAVEYLRLMRSHIRKENARLLPLCRDTFQGQRDLQVLEAMTEVEERLLEPGEKEQILADLEKIT